MTGRTKWGDIKKKRDDEPGIEERREAARSELEAEIAAFEATLSQLRRARSLTQTQLSKALGVSQAEVSRIEHQTDLYLSTLRSYIEAMGGELELVATFDDARVVLELEDVTTTAETPSEPLGDAEIPAALEEALNRLSRADITDVDVIADALNVTKQEAAEIARDIAKGRALRTYH